MIKHQYRPIIINLILALLAAGLLYLVLKPTQHHQARPKPHPVKKMRVTWRLSGILWDPSDPSNSSILIQTANGKSKLIKNNSFVNASQHISIVNSQKITVSEGKQSTSLWLNVQRKRR